MGPLYPGDPIGLQVICEAADAESFCSVTTDDDHVLHHLLPPSKPNINNLQKRIHEYVIPECDDSLMNKNFIIRPGLELTEGG